MMQGQLLNQIKEVTSNVMVNVVQIIDTPSPDINQEIKGGDGCFGKIWIGH